MNCAQHPEVAATAYCRTCGKALCDACKREVQGTIFCEPCLAARIQPGAGSSYSAGAEYAPPRAPENASPGLALFLGIYSGGGAFYNGQYLKGFVHVIVMSTLIWMSDHGMGAFASLLIAAWFFYMVFDAWTTAKARRDGLPIPDPIGLNAILEGREGTFRERVEQAGERLGAHVEYAAHNLGQHWQKAGGTARRGRLRTLPESQAQVRVRTREVQTRRVRAQGRLRIRVGRHRRREAGRGEPGIARRPLLSGCGRLPWIRVWRAERTRAQSAGGGSADWAGSVVPAGKPGVVQLSLGYPFLAGDFNCDWGLAVHSTPARSAVKGESAMGYYQPNPACRCGRCSTRGLMGPAVLITLGLLFLLANNPEYPFERTWPILLIVIGAIKVAGYAMPGREHRNSGQYPPPYQVPYGGKSEAAQSGTAQSGTWANEPVITPPPAPSAGALGEGSGENRGVQNG